MVRADAIKGPLSPATNTLVYSSTKPRARNSAGGSSYRKLMMSRLFLRPSHHVSNLQVKSNMAKGGETGHP
ncbi:hypothetical protein KIL84_001573 [Mauremys mutica]|uniref:Uncharacterized protein n=1 Tax=Mauremys mutica TaxID=74926 RepID=A0A9D3XFM2_9SAUR|nr:hypothetical protein KIL84_001573 [Mauremys mutica]